MNTSGTLVRLRRLVTFSSVIADSSGPRLLTRSGSAELFRAGWPINGFLDPIAASSFNPGVQRSWKAGTSTPASPVWNTRK